MKFRSKSPSAISLWTLAVLALALLPGCNPAKSKREAERAKREQMRKEIHAQSEKIWQESTQKKITTGGDLKIGDQTITFSELSLYLGSISLTNSSDQQPSQLKSSSGNPFLEISSLPIQGATNSLQLAGRSVNLTENLNSKILSSDGNRSWKLLDAGIFFNRAEDDVIYFTIEGQASELNGASAEKVKVLGDLKARVIESSPTPSNSPNH